ncbi:MAG: glycine cleavage system protein GcvH [Chloroflexi bacterium]|nr:glycine cleavage system protein GcvH [Chloroflexota bacterium]
MATINNCKIPDELYYWPEKHVWARPEGDGTVTIGMTDVAQNMAKRFISCTIKKTARPLEKGKSVATVESGKWVGPVPMPVSGEIAATNDAVSKKPDLINAEPYGAGWIARIKPVNWDADRAALVTGPEGTEAYRKFLDQEGIKCE